MQFEIIPPYTRIKRLIRDIPSTEIAAGSSITNLRQLTEIDMIKELQASEELRHSLYGRLYRNVEIFSSLEDVVMNIIAGEEQMMLVGQQPNISAERNFVALDTRAREIRNRKVKAEPENEIANLVVRHYQSSVGDEFFISYEDELGYLYGFTRLLLPKAEHVITWEGLGENIALIRELHVYGQMAKINAESADKTQHRGFGSRLMETAEKIAQHFGYEKLSVIS